MTFQERCKNSKGRCAPLHTSPQNPALMQINHHSQKEHTKISKLLQSMVAKCCKIWKIYSLGKFANFVYFCIACENCNTKVYKICKLWKAIYFLHFTTFRKPNFAILIILVCPSWEYTFFAIIKIKN
jgi:hypothetical protein